VYFPAPSAPPGDLSGSAVGPSVIQMQWSIPPYEFRNGMIRSYRVHILERETRSVTRVIAYTVSSTLTDLHPDYTYEIRVAAISIAEGPYSNAVVIKMPISSEFKICKVVKSHL